MNWIIKVLLTAVLLSTNISYGSDKKPITIIVSTPAGGTGDLMGRYVAQVLENANIPTVVINKTGAQGIIGTRYVAETKDKNSTLLLLSSGPTVAAWAAKDPKPYDVFKDFDPITLLATDATVVVVGEKSKFNTLKELIIELKKRPGEMSYATGAMSNFMGAKMFMDKTKTTGIAVQYQGNAPAKTDIISGQVDFGFISYADTKDLAVGGKIKILGVADIKRRNDELNIPTLVEQGVNFTDPNVWYAVVAPRGMEPQLVANLNRILVDGVNRDRNTNPRLTVLKAVGSSPDELSDFMKNYYKIWGPRIRRTAE